MKITLMKKYFLGLLLFTSLLVNAQTQTAKPWTRWWWMGSAVDEAGIKKQLTQLAAAGFGGVEIVPIYGAKGFESRYIKYLSAEWMKMLDYTVAQANALNMGVYISVGTGWPIGGSHVTTEDAATKLVLQKYKLKANEVLADKIVINDVKQKNVAILNTVMAYTATGKTIDVTKQVDAIGKLSLTFKEDVELVAAFVSKTRQAVKRAAPGGEGFTIDHFSKAATANYFKIFDTAFGNSSHGVKAFFNDSYEVYNADWTPAFFEEFQKRRGYDLRKYLNYFTSKAENDTVARLKSDYRETISDLMLQNFSTVFTRWTNKRNTKSVNQAHGSPGNLLDLYGTFDIPECETFGSTAFGVKGLRRDIGDVRNVDPDPIMLKFASSAAHFYKKPLTSSETFTWLGEHFKTSWSQCKPEVDQVFLSGINHVFYHGTTYTPADVNFPGWLFYASVNFVPYNSMWKHLKGLNEYIARVQDVLQGTPSDNIKIYWPVYDVWHDAKGLDMPLAVHHIKEWLHPTAFYKDVQQLQNAGYEVDFVSDKMVKELADNALFDKIFDGRKTVVVPACDLMPLQTLRNIIDLAKTSITYVIIEALPKDVAGFNNLQQDRLAMKKLIDSLKITKVSDLISESRMKLAGKIIVCNDVAKALEYLSIACESSLTKLGFKFISSQKGDVKYYFISNNTSKDIDENISLNVSPTAITFINPLNGESGGPLYEKKNGMVTNLRLQLKSGQSIIVRANLKFMLKQRGWNYIDVTNNTINLENNKWTLKFTEGGPYLPKERTLSKLQPWTDFIDDSTTQSFSGTAFYTTTFNIKERAQEYLLQLDKLYESARIIINGKDAGIIWSLPYEIKIGNYLKQGKNTISIEVCNLMANRMRNMDINKQLWRNYNEINFVNINYKPFDASTWKVQPSGLGGAVAITALK
jgi:hypothetical protein